MMQDMHIPNYFQILFNRIDQLEEQISHLANCQPKSAQVHREEKKLYNVEEAADFLSVSKTSIYILKAQNQISYMKKGKRLYFTRESLLKYIEGDSFSPMSQDRPEPIQRFLKPRRKKLGS